MNQKSLQYTPIMPIILLSLAFYQPCSISFPPVACWPVVAPRSGFRPALLSVFGGEIVHLLRQVRQLDQAFLEVLFQPGHLRLQGQDRLTKHKRMQILKSICTLVNNLNTDCSIAYILTYYRSKDTVGCLSLVHPWWCWVQVQIRGDGAGKAWCVQILSDQWWGSVHHFSTDQVRSNNKRLSLGLICSPCSLTEGSLVVLSTHRSTAAAAPQDCVWTDGWGLAHRWLLMHAEWMVVCRLEQEPSLPELLKASFWDCTLQTGGSRFSQSSSTDAHFINHFNKYFIVSVYIDLYLSVSRFGWDDPEPDWFK